MNKATLILTALLVISIATGSLAEEGMASYYADSLQGKLNLFQRPGRLLLVGDRHLLLLDRINT